MSKTGKYRSLGLGSKSSVVRANALFRATAYIIDAILIRFAFEIIVFLLGFGGLISGSLLENIRLYLGYGLAPMRGGGLLLEQMFFINTLEDVMIHLAYSLLFLVYFVVLESRKMGGQTLGKKFFGIKVVDGDRTEISSKVSILRNSTKYLLRVPILGLFLGAADFILLVFYSTRSGDMLADTEVVSLSGKGIVSRIRSE